MIERLRRIPRSGWLIVRRKGIFLSAFLALLAVGCASVWAEDSRYFRIGTAATTGTYFQIGAAIANAISKAPGSRDCERGGSCGVPGLVAVAQATQGSVENVGSISAGRLDSAFVQSDIAHWAFTGTGLFKNRGAVPKLRAIASLFPETVHIVVRADGPIATLRDLKGKRVAIGEKESGTIVDARLILDAAGISEKDIKAENLRLAQAAQALDAGSIDAFFLIAGYPVPAIAELAAITPIRLVAVPHEIAQKVKRRFNFFDETTVPAAAYAGLDEAVPTVSISALWLVSAEVSDDLVYAITKALWRDSTRRTLDNSHPMAARIRLSAALDGLSVPLHPGAERFYRESGMSAPDIKP